jgi:hypothetical protein
MPRPIDFVHAQHFVTVTALLEGKTISKQQRIFLRTVCCADGMEKVSCPCVLFSTILYKAHKIVCAQQLAEEV